MMHNMGKAITHIVLKQQIAQDNVNTNGYFTRDMEDNCHALRVSNVPPTEDGMIDDHAECEEDDRDAQSLDLEPEVKTHIGKNVFVVGKRVFKKIDIREYFFLATKKLQVRTLQKLHMAFR